MSNINETPSPIQFRSTLIYHTAVLLPYRSCISRHSLKRNRHF